MGFFGHFCPKIRINTAPLVFHNKKAAVSCGFE
jgi:hypothetical protein